MRYASKPGRLGLKYQQEYLGMMDRGMMVDPGCLDGKDKRKAVVSWTGGKDGCYACYRAMEEGSQITHLLNFRNAKKIGSHEINPMVIQAQSQAIGIPLIQRKALPFFIKEVALEASSSIDGKTWKFSIKDYLYWSDRKKLTAEDVKFTFDYLAENYPAAGWTKSTVEDITIRRYLRNPCLLSSPIRSP